MQLSIIIALYNTEAYIEKCIRSIYFLDQLNISHFEVIVINDGSTDNSRSIVEKLKAEFSNLILINKDNGGQSSARNIGFNMAQGEYIFCLDSDDYIDSTEMFNALQYCLEKNLDMLPIYFNKRNEAFELLTQKNDIYPIFDQIISGGEFLNKFVVSGSMWRYFYRASIMTDNNLLLTEGIFHEDEEFVIKFMSYSKRIAYGRHLVYNHIVRGDSTVNKKNAEHRRKLLNDIITVMDHLKQHLDKFERTSTEYNGVKKKIEQLSVSIFFRMKKDKISYDDTKFFLTKMTNLGLYPLKITKLDSKFKFASVFFNNQLFNKLYFR
jgi:Glycosyltransferases involved in cell wall biogenesis